MAREAVAREREDGWRGRVNFTPGGLAYRPGEVLVRSAVAEVALARINELFDATIDGEELAGDWVKLSGVPEPIEALGLLRGAGVFAQPNHVLFANACCPPHPSKVGVGADPFLANPFLANPFLANPFLANPFLANPFLANPFLANPFLANPFLANAVGGGCCCCGGAGGLGANPFLANANVNPSAVPRIQETGRRPSSARPAASPDVTAQEPYAEPEVEVRIAILDTGFAASDKPTGLANIDVVPHGGDHPDEDGDQYLDPVAGHGTFIAGIIEQITPGCRLELFEVLSTYGDGGEAEIGQQLMALADRDSDERPHLVNLSFGAYSPIGMEYVADAVGRLHEKGVIVVASAGNEATCIPTYPAALPNVISVGALDEDGWPAEYTNYGPWVRACTRGTDVVSLFFEGFDGAEPEVDGKDIDAFDGWARWSGTSFAAPRVVAALASKLQAGESAEDAVSNLIDDDQRPRLPMLGTVVLP